MRSFIRAVDEVTAVARFEAFPEVGPGADTSFYVAFPHVAPPVAARDKLLGLCSDVDEIAIHEREVYWLCRGRMSDTAFSGALLEKTLGVPATMRNITTVRKLAAKYGRGG